MGVDIGLLPNICQRTRDIVNGQENGKNFLSKKIRLGIKIF